MAGLTIQDILQMTPKFCNMHLQPLVALDGGALTLLTVQTNLFIGTLAPFAMQRPELRSILKAAMNFEISGQFMLTEVDHGLDARNLRTTATIMPDGDINLHTPSPDDAKVMPPATPRSGIPIVAIVMARLVAEGNDCGVRPILVQIGDGNQMCQNIISKALPTRTGTHPIDHTVTYFSHVRLPRSALLGSIEGTGDKRADFASAIHRVAVGTLCISGSVIPFLKVASYVADQYSRNRLSLPILHAVAQYSILESFFISAAKSFGDMSLDPRVRHGIATAFKAVAINHFSKSIKAMNERCGWHGHFAHNQLLQLELEMRGASTAEGDLRVLAIRLASELLIGRYELPPPRSPTSFVAQHETALFSEAKSLLQHSAQGNHRSESFNRNILPLCLPLVEAIGYRMAFEAAQEANVNPKLVQLYQAGVIKEDPAWYAEQGGLCRDVQREMESHAVDDLLPHLQNIMQESGMQDYCNAPMASKFLWDGFVGRLETFKGNAPPDLLARL
ncbi:unnamed protein product [Penicillium salamii]|uniref:Acyl-CoA dehydrogenase NM domain-like protein n=1 Tax=Penicillium salamii TaxID=1612424 RepID=A0A9W4J5R0_9EURO|nr:unnamed protein product [Penicillium salamii]CAG8124723.1 unnamed protein product [Penicillium salamii]CAG8225052.1 unnamed protein product [Penicillium salamii]CAG8306268.1 unnamed protein product [Penicillium salamii]CAG8328174.1 unnamed protein product [Penicillium salamii]